jgi:hypothetical protein
MNTRPEKMALEARMAIGSKSLPISKLRFLERATLTSIAAKSVCAGDTLY